MSVPLLGVAGTWGAAEIELARRFDDLHQLLYRRGGLRPSNAVVEEIAKLVLIRLWSLRQTRPVPVPTERPLPGVSADLFRSSFAAALATRELRACDPSGRTHPIWPQDEPFRSPMRGAGGRVHAGGPLVTAAQPAVADPLGTAFDALLAGRHDHAGGLGTYLTPSAVATMMAEVGGAARPTPHRTAMGPASATRTVAPAGSWWRCWRCCATADDALLAAGPFGADESPAAVAKARINMLLYGVRQPLVWTVTRLGHRLRCGQAGRPGAADPDQSAVRRGQVRRPGRRRRTGRPICPGWPVGPGSTPAWPAWSGRCGLLAPGGVLGIVLPDGVIARPPSRTWCSPAAGRSAAQVSLAAAVSLPTATFALSGTVAKTSAVFLRRPAPVTQVAVARVHHVGYLRQAGRAAPDPAGNELPAVAAAHQRPRERRSRSTRWSRSCRRNPSARSTRPGSTPTRWRPGRRCWPAGVWRCRTFLRSVPVRPFRPSSPRRTSPCCTSTTWARSTGGRGRAYADHPGHPGPSRGPHRVPAQPVEAAGRRHSRCRSRPRPSSGCSPPTTTRTPCSDCSTPRWSGRQLRPLGTGTSSSRRRIESPPPCITIS